MTAPGYSGLHLFDPKGGLVVPSGQSILTISEPAAPRGTSYMNWTGPLFATPPTPSDIKQGALGNCFVLAGLNALLAMPNGSVVLQRSLLDEGSNVVLRMHKDGACGYVRVSKRLIDKDAFFGKTPYNLGAKWVRLVEKAFAGYIVGGYLKMVDGRASKVIETFFGDAHTVAAGQPMRPGDPSPASELFFRLVGFHKGVDSGKRERVAATELALVGMLLSIDPGHDETRARRRVAAWKAWNSRDKELLFVGFTKNSAHESFDAFLLRVGGELNVDVRTAVLAWYNANQPFPGVLGSAVYTADQINFYRRLSRAVATQRSVSVATNNVLKGVGGRAHATGETEINGLVSGHAYSVIGTKEERRGTTVPAVTLYYLGIRNPWGKVSRDYTTGSGGVMTPTARTGSGDLAESWIELTDFMDNFENAFFEGPQVHDAGRAALLNPSGTSLDAQLVAQRARLNPTAVPTRPALEWNGPGVVPMRPRRLGGPG